MCAMGVDVAAGGADDTVLSARYDGYFCELIEVSGRETPNGSDVAALVVKHRRDNAEVILDMQGGYGGAVFERLTDNGIVSYKFKGAEKAVGRTKEGGLKFTNKRTEAYWRIREALDPDQSGGSPIMLPNDAKLAAQLCSVRFQMTAQGIAAEDKISVIKRLGRSPDKADALIMSWYKGVTGGYQRGLYGASEAGGSPYKVIHAYEQRKKRYRR
jgi:hypothetical protein